MGCNLYVCRFLAVLCLDVFNGLQAVCTLFSGCSMFGRIQWVAICLHIVFWLFYVWTYLMGCNLSVCRFLAVPCLDVFNGLLSVCMLFATQSNFGGRGIVNASKVLSVRPIPPSVQILSGPVL